MALEHEELTERIIGAAIDVHRKLGPGFLESIYENALVIALDKIGFKVKRQKEIPVIFEGKEIGRHRLDLLVNDTKILELKAVKYFKDVHFAVVRSYLRAFGLQHGLLMNFSKTVLDVKRVICK